MTTQKARPILFSAPMIRALLADRKTQTRRIIKPQPVRPVRPDDGAYFDAYNGGPQWNWWLPDNRQCLDQIITCPYGKPGDLIWVRETWAQVHPAAIPADRPSSQGRAGIPGPPPVTYRSVYRAEGEVNRVWHCADYPWRTTVGPRDEIASKFPEVNSECPGWTPSIYMPRWASRLTLELTDVRVEKLQEISEADAQAEGVPAYVPDSVIQQGSAWFRMGYLDLWNQINGFGSWDANKFVWILTFIVHKQNIDKLAA